MNKNIIYICIVMLIIIGIFVLTLKSNNNTTNKESKNITYTVDNVTNEIVIYDENNNERGRVTNNADLKMYEDFLNFSSKAYGNYENVIE